MIQGNKIEIPFGASDSEPYYEEIIIPDGLEAIMEDGKIILRRKETKDENIRKNCIHFLELQKKYHASTVEIDECIAWLEKQKPKPLVKSALEAVHEEKVDNSNKVEGNFKIGAWIVSNYNENVFLIKSTSCGYFTLEDINGNIYDVCLPPTKDDYHLWSIKDAKDGDILVSEYNKPFIYNGKHISDSVGAHCGINIHDQFTVSITECDWTDYDVKPATKEQSDLLFQEMKEMGWEWDAEKKKLKRMQKAKWSEEDSKVIDNCCLLIGVADECYEKAFKDDCIHYLQNLKQRMTNDK